MGAAAQFERIDGPARAMGIAAHGDDAHLVAIFLAEQRHGTLGNGGIDRHQPRGDRIVLQHDLVGHGLDLGNLVGRHRLVVGEVEAQPVGLHQRALLRHMGAQRDAQRLVQQMGGRVMARLPERRA